MKFCLIGIIIFKLKGRDRLDMAAELKVQFCTEKLYDQFDTIKPFLQCTIKINKTSKKSP